MVVDILSLKGQTITNTRKLKRYKVKEVIRMLEVDGWYLHNQKGSHRQYKHPIKSGKVTVNQKPNDTIDQ